MLTLAESKRQRRAILREIALEHKAKDRAKLVELRQGIRDATARRKVAMHEAVLMCRQGRVIAGQLAKERVAELRKAAKEAIRVARLEEKHKARAACDARKQKINESPLTSREKAKQLLRAERNYQKQLRMMEAHSRQRVREKPKTTWKERQSESDDEVRRNIPDELVPFFEAVKRQIKGSTRRSRTEEFLEYAEENPEMVVDLMDELAQRDIARLIREEAALAKAVRSPGRYKPTAEELAAIPF